MVCIELAWPSPSIIDKTPCGARCSQPSLVLVCWSLIHSWGWLGFLHGHMGVDLSCGFFGADFWVRIFFRGFWGAEFFVDFVMSCADFGVRIFFCGFFGLFFRRKSPEKSHQKSHRKILTKDLVQAFLHSPPPRPFWQNTADLLRASGCRCTL